MSARVKWQRGKKNEGEKVQGSNSIASVVFILNFRCSSIASTSVKQNICVSHHVGESLSFSKPLDTSETIEDRMKMSLFYALEELVFLAILFILLILFEIPQESHTAKKCSSSTCPPSKTPKSSSLHPSTSSTSDSATTSGRGVSESLATRPAASSLPPHCSSSVDHPQAQVLQRHWET